MRHLLLLTLLLMAGAPATGTAQTADDLFNPDFVHRLDVLVNSRDWEKLKVDFLTNEYYPADIRWNGLTVRNVGIRSRGLSTRSGTKPALRVDMNRYTTGQEFLGLKSFLLDNLLSDPTGLKEMLAMRMHARLGLPAPREAHVALYVNNVYAGLYGIVESIDKDFLARQFGEREPGDTENDGHLFEYDWIDPWRWSYLGPELDAYAPRFDPQTNEHASTAELYGPIEEMVRAVNEAPDFVAGVSPYLDLPLAMKQLAVQNFVAELDGILGGNGTANFHFYRFENSTRSQFIPWDEDNAFQAPDWPISQFHQDYVLMQRAMQVPALRSAYLDGLLEAADAASAPATDDLTGPGWLEQEIQIRRAQIAPFVYADPLKPYTNEEFEAAMDTLAAFPRARAEFVRAAVAGAR
jgi:spore coat protein H